MALDYEALDYEAAVPENNLRLPDAVTVRHGPGPVLGRFVLAGDQQARKAGIHLRLRTDFEGSAGPQQAADRARQLVPTARHVQPRGHRRLGQERVLDRRRER